MSLPNRVGTYCGRIEQAATLRLNLTSVRGMYIAEALSSRRFITLHTHGATKTHPFIKAQHAYVQVVIFNWLGRPNKNTVLGELATMSEAATFINRGQRGNAFGHLILLLRDVQLGGEKEVYSIVFENEDPDDAGTDEEATAMEERNKTRNLLKKTFETVRVVCMPPPHAQIGGRYMFFLVLFNATLLCIG